MRNLVKVRVYFRGSCLSNENLVKKAQEMLETVKICIEEIVRKLCWKLSSEDPVIKAQEMPEIVKICIEEIVRKLCWKLSSEDPVI